jgi:energy-coupling factor transporter ATP-binding protein EcfA2
MTVSSCLSLRPDMRVAVFVDQLGDLYLAIHYDYRVPRLEVCPINARNRRFRHLMRQFYGRNLTRPEMTEFVDKCHSIAEAQPRRILSQRFATRGDAVYIDLGGDTGQCGIVTPEGWRVGPSPEPIFRPNGRQLPLPTPEHGGTLNDLSRLLDIPPDAQLLVLTWLCAALWNKAPVPLLLLIGPPGSGKTTLCLLLRRLIDPCAAELLGEAERSQLHLLFSQSALLVFDNMALLSRAESDLCCRAVTGGATQRRRLYTDCDSVVFRFRLPVIFNGTDLPTVRADFLERSLLICPRRFSSFRSPLDLEAEFTRNHPRLLGSLFDLLARVLQLWSDIESPTDFRFPEFVRLGRAVAVAIGRQPDDFELAYRASLDRAYGEASQHDPLIDAMVELVQHIDRHTNSAGGWLKLLHRHRSHLSACELETLPRNAATFGKWLTEHCNLLESRGLRIDKTRTGTARLISITFQGRKHD